MHKKSITLSELNRKTIRLSYKQKDFKRLNFHHSNLVVEGIDSISEFLKLTPIKEGDNTMVIMTNSLNKTKEINEIEKHERTNYINKMVKSFSIVTSILITIGIVILITICIKPIIAIAIRIANWLTNLINRNASQQQTQVKFNQDEQFELIIEPISISKQINTNTIEPIKQEDKNIILKRINEDEI